MTKPLILATGFGVFPGAPENPTAWAMGELEREGWQPEAARLVTRVLDVRFDMWERELQPLLASTKPEGVVAFGLSAKAKGVTLESTARNRVSKDRPDFTGARVSSDCISDGAAAVYPSRLPLREISQGLAKGDVRMARSDDAGDYICNLLFYRLMEFAESGGPKVAGFVHVPYLESQAARLTAAGLTLDGATLSEDELMRGVKCIVSAVADELAARKSKGDRQWSVN